MHGVSLVDHELFWAPVLVIGFPAATVALDEIIMRLRRAGSPLGSPLALVRNLVLPTLALQDPLGNLFSGLVLLFERPLKVGDWIQLGENNGQVVETNWRAVHLLTRSKDLIIIPNSALAKSSFINFSRPSALHRETIAIQFSRNDPPSKVMRVLAEVAQRTPGIIEHPSQAISLLTYK